MPQGGKPGTIPTDLEQATGLERLEILGKMQGVDVFDMRPLDASRKGVPEHHESPDTQDTNAYLYKARSKTQSSSSPSATSSTSAAPDIQ